MTPRIDPVETPEQKVVENPDAPEQTPEPERFKTVLTVYTDDRDNFKIDLGKITEAEIKKHIESLLGALNTVRIGDGLLLQNSNGTIHIVNVTKVTHFDVRTD